MSLFDLHCVIQVAMGWSHSHLFEFRRGDLLFGIDYPDADLPPELINPVHIKICSVLQRPGQTMVYIYDLGDYWKHSIKLNRHVSKSVATHLPFCLEGNGNCPPEDCGGIHSFNEILKVLKDPAHEDYKGFKRMFGKKYDPYIFEIDKVNRKFSRIKSVIRDYKVGCGILFY